MENVISLILLFVSIGVSNARVVSVSPGPLLRVEGQPVSLRCDVTDYEGPREQDFEWTMTVASKTIPVISTFDPKYSDSSLSNRVTSGDLAVVRLGDSSVELKIQKVRSSDSATYTCSTPSTDSVITGNYKADVTLKVIADTLKVTTVTPEPIVPEGGDITLFCNISRQFTDPTYLSVTWSLNKTGVSSADILSFGPDGGVVTASSYAQRYAEGGLRLAVRGDGLFGLVITRVTQGDAGTYMCTGKEWTHEAGGRWKSILGKTVKMGAVAVTPTAQSLSVEARSNTTLNMDDTLTLTCLVAVANLASVALEVNWLMNGGSVVSLGRDGVVVDGSPLVGLERAGPGDFRLVVRGVRKANEGEYSCRVRAWISRGGPGGGWYQAAEKTSNPVQVLVTRIIFPPTVIADTLKVTTVTPEPIVPEGGDITLFCNISRQFTDPTYLSVTWSLNKTGVSSADILSFGPDGGVVAASSYAQRYAEGGLRLAVRGDGLFGLVITRVTQGDAGTYMCTGKEWTHEAGGRWKSILGKTVKMGAVAVTPTAQSLSLEARSDTTLNMDDTLTLTCLVAVANLASVALEVNWLMNGGSVVSLGRDGVVVDGSPLVGLERAGPGDFRLVVRGVRKANEGEYSCRVRAWISRGGPGGGWYQAAEKTSNPVQVLVTRIKSSGASCDVIGIVLRSILGTAAIIIPVCFLVWRIKTGPPNNPMREFRKICVGMCYTIT
ncbi:immunoglobulin superfamily member 3-like isoform X2 [Esox lucius]|uniref:immunoglobulin superfamily member 3-like isoform X2 n=1 Tax=Esox lucius TaxID=8010 RepID=UPI001476EB19|nr:immunoglobulin superfamily member 3-like isoform X2 [Esox lucius]